MPRPPGFDSWMGPTPDAVALKGYLSGSGSGQLLIQFEPQTLYQHVSVE